MPTLNQLNQLNKIEWINPCSPVYRVGLKLRRFLRLRGECLGRVLLVIRRMTLE